MVYYILVNERGFTVNLKYKKTKQAIVVVLLGLTATLGYSTYSLNTAYAEERTQHTQAEAKVAKHQEAIKKKESELSETTKELKKVEESKKATEEEKEEMAKKAIELEQKVEKLEQDLKAKKERETAELAKKETQTPSQSVEPNADKPEATPVATPVVKEEAKSEEPKETAVEATSESLGTFTVTHYAIYDWGTPSTVTANGTDIANTIYSPEGYRIIAVDTSVIPMNSIVQVTIGGNTFLAKASDTGSAINGNKIDLLVSSPSEASNLGVTTATIEMVK